MTASEANRLIFRKPEPDDEDEEQRAEVRV